MGERMDAADTQYRPPLLRFVVVHAPVFQFVRRARYQAVTEASGVLSAKAMTGLIGTDLQQIWLDHLLALSMLQAPLPHWTFAGFVLVHPAKNPSYARAAERYRSLLNDASSFQVSTIESLLAAEVLPQEVGKAFGERYGW